MNDETHSPMRYERVTYKPEGKRARHIFLKQPSEKVILGEVCLVGIQAARDGSLWGTKEVDQRMCVIALDQISTRIPMRINKRYGLLEDEETFDAYAPDAADRPVTWNDALDFAERCANPDSNIG